MLARNRSRRRRLKQLPSEATVLLWGGGRELSGESFVRLFIGSTVQNRQATPTLGSIKTPQILFQYPVATSGATRNSNAEISRMRISVCAETPTPLVRMTPPGIWRRKSAYPTRQASNRSHLRLRWSNTPTRAAPSSASRCGAAPMCNESSRSRRFQKVRPTDRATLAWVSKKKPNPTPVVMPNEYGPARRRIGLPSTQVIRWQALGHGPQAAFEGSRLVSDPAGSFAIGGFAQGLDSAAEGVPLAGATPARNIKSNTTPWTQRSCPHPGRTGSCRAQSRRICHEPFTQVSMVNPAPHRVSVSLHGPVLLFRSATGSDPSHPISGHLMDCCTGPPRPG